MRMPRICWGLVAAQVDLTLAEIQRRARPGARGARCYRHAVGLLSAAGPDVQKKTGHAEEQDRPAVQTARAAWAKRQPTLDPARLIFLDETGLNTKLARVHGRGRRGERLVASLPHGHWSTTTFIAGLRADGLTAPMLLPGSLRRPRLPGPMSSRC